MDSDTEPTEVPAYSKKTTSKVGVGAFKVCKRDASKKYFDRVPGTVVSLRPVLRIHDILMWIHVSEQWIRIRIRILLFSSLTFKIPTKN